MAKRRMIPMGRYADELPVQLAASMDGRLTIIAIAVSSALHDFAGRPCAAKRVVVKLAEERNLKTQTTEP